MMAGIYVHIPFCRKACRYCDFYFTVSLRFREVFIEGILKEIEARKNFFGEQTIDTIYFGGGTPSVLNRDEIKQILDALKKAFTLSDQPEQTLEANPDDLDPESLRHLKALSFNRLSIGVQSFHQQDLDLMNRSHHAAQAERAVRDALEMGFDNLNLDLIYGIPGLTTQAWHENLQRATSLPFNHLSAYHLTFEEGTVFDHWRKKGRLHEVTDKVSEQQYNMLREITNQTGFDHYEISNFARNGKYSQHNRSYWTGEPYLGLGPAAHSYDGTKRYWNVASLKKYLHAIEYDLPFFESEQPGIRDRFNEYMITRMRTSAGSDTTYIEKEFPDEIVQHYHQVTGTLLESGLLHRNGPQIKIPAEKWLMADGIIRELMM